MQVWLGSKRVKPSGFLGSAAGRVVVAPAGTGHAGGDTGVRSAVQGAVESHASGVLRSPTRRREDAERPSLRTRKAPRAEAREP